MTDSRQPTRPFAVVHDEAPADHAAARRGGRHRQFRRRAPRPPRGDRGRAARAPRRSAGRRRRSPSSRTRAASSGRSEPLFRLTDERDKLRLLAATGLDGAIVLRFDAALARALGRGLRRAHPGRAAGRLRRCDRLRFPFRRRTGPARPAISRRRAPSTASPSTSCRGSRTTAARSRSGPIRAALAAGRSAEAAEMLGYPWFVIRRSRARRQARARARLSDRQSAARSRPAASSTASMRCASASAAAAMTASRVSAAGRCSTVGTVLLEVFLFDFAGDLYGQTIDVAFIEWIRPELKFDSVEELVRRMDEDAASRAPRWRRPDAFPPLARALSSLERLVPVLHRGIAADRGTIPSPARPRGSRRPPAARCGADRCCGRSAWPCRAFPDQTKATGCAPRARAWRARWSGAAQISAPSAPRMAISTKDRAKISAAVSGL